MRAGRIRVSYASHSPQVEAAREQLLSALAGIEPRPSELPLYSTVTGEPADTALMDAEHWFDNLRRTVLFEPAIRGMVKAGIDALIEVGPHPILLSPASQTLDSIENGGTVATIGSLRRDEGGWERFLTSLAEAHTCGVRIDWESLFAGAGRVALPTYAFQRERYWLPPTPAARTCTAARSAPTGTVSSSKSTGARSRGRRTDRGGGWPSSETAHRRPPSVPPSSGTPTSRR